MHTIFLIGKLFFRSLYLADSKAKYNFYYKFCLDLRYSVLFLVISTSIKLRMQTVYLVQHSSSHMCSLSSSCCSTCSWLSSMTRMLKWNLILHNRRVNSRSEITSRRFAYIYFCILAWQLTMLMKCLQKLQYISIYCLWNECSSNIAVMFYDIQANDH